MKTVTKVYIPIQCVCLEPGGGGDGKTGRKKDVGMDVGLPC